MKRSIFGRFSTFAVVSAALSLSTPVFGQAQAAETKAPLPAATAMKATTSTGVQVPAAEKPGVPARKPGQEGVTMHGHWTIDLKNPDGTIAEHREFENSLMSPGFLLSIVNGQAVPGDLGITIASTESYVCTAANAGMPGPLGSCLLAASPAAGLGGLTCAATAAGVCNYNLQESFVVATGVITLTGYIPVLASGRVTGVGTQILTCNSSFSTGTGFTTVDPVSCYTQSTPSTYTYGTLTGTSIRDLTVTTGQTITLSVVLSFS